MVAPRFTGLRARSDLTSRVARSIASRNSRAELALRRELWALGLRYRVHWGLLAGRPDIAFPAARLVVFVDGDFWHGRNWQVRRCRLMRGSNSSYWVAKIESNMRRDRDQTEALARDGWRVLRFWEREVLNSTLGIARMIAVAVCEQGLSSRATRRSVIQASTLDWLEPS